MKNRVTLLSFSVLIIGGLSFSIAFPSFNILFIDPSFQSLFIQSYGEPFVLYGFLLAVYSLGQLFGAPLLGDLSDRFGRKRLLLYTIIGGCIGNALCAISILSHQYLGLLLSRLVTGFLCANTPICLSLIMEQIPQQQKQLRIMSNVVIINGLAWIGGVLIGALLSNPQIIKNYHPAYAFVLPSLLFFLTYFIGRRSIEIESIASTLSLSFKNFRDSCANIKSVFDIKELRIYYLIFFLWMVGWGMIFQWYNIYCSLYLQATPFKIAVSQCLNGVSSIMGGVFLNKILRKYFHYSTIIMGSFVSVLLLTLGMIFCGTFTGFATCFILACFPAALLWSSMLVRIGANVQDNFRGKVLGIAQSSESIAFVGATLLGGFFETKIPGKLLMFAFLFILGCIFINSLRKQPKRDSQYSTRFRVRE